MIYLTGDTHTDFGRFTNKMRSRLPFVLTEKDHVIVTGDLGLLWVDNKSFRYNLDWMSRLPFKLLWVQGNHENYDMIKEYPVEFWHGGKVRHILRDKIILLERGQIFSIEDQTFFTFGGASTHDAPGGILDRNSSDFEEKKKRAVRKKQRYRVVGETWWPEELPAETEFLEGRENLKKVDYRVDYVISHCGSNRVQRIFMDFYAEKYRKEKYYDKNLLTDFFDELEEKLEYKRWFMGHYHHDLEIDDKHRILDEKIIPLY